MILKIKEDPKNTNKHTEEGMELLDHSVQAVGIIEAITVSEDGVIISGHARNEIISKYAKKDPIVVESDGNTPIIIKRTDIQSNTKKFHEASILANTTAKKNINIDLEAVDILVDEFDIDPIELGVEPAEQEKGSSNKGSSQTSAPNMSGEVYLNVKCVSEREAEKLYNELINQGYECKIMS